jgi:hypothetical protein
LAIFGKIANPGTSTNTQFAGDVPNIIWNLLHDVNIASADTTKRPLISTPWIYRSGTLLISDPDKFATYTILTTDVNSDKQITIPPPIGTTDDFLLKDTVQSMSGKTIDFNLNTFLNNPGITASSIATLSNKTISTANNTISGIADANISAHTTSKIITTSKALLNTAIAYQDQTNSFADFDQTFRSSRVRIRNPANSFSYLIAGGAITADRTLTLPTVGSNDIVVTESMAQTLGSKTLTNPIITSISNGGTVTIPSGTTQLMGRDTVDTMTNKTLDARGTGNSLPNVECSPLVKRTGKAQPVASGTTPTNIMVYEGTLSQHIGTGAGSNNCTFDTTEGLIANYATTATGNLNAGIVSPTTGLAGRRLFGMRAVTRAKLSASTSSRFYFGFTNAGTLPISDTPLATGDSGIIVGYSGASTNWTIFHNDGGGAAIADNLLTPTAKDALFRTIEINWTPSGNVNVIFDGVAQTPISTRIPATTQNLLFNCLGQTTTTSARTFSIAGAWMESDK